ncbi:MAG TPA: ABC transporter ATP-binding protein [Dehalococcoidia bacterium]|nr:ABC transporter ATP-binding protein [Dehalococcoidia bacterium]
MFELMGLHSYYGKSHVVQGISLNVGDGEAVGLVGRNGVGKTTTLKSIVGLVAGTKGRVLLNGADMASRPTHLRAALGIGYVPEERAVFPNMTVEENIRIGAMLLSGNRDSVLTTAYDLFPLLRERRSQLAGTLSGGQQKMLGLARGLALRPKLLLVDEPSEGLMPINMELIARALLKATDEGISVLVVDASFDLLRIACKRLYVMDNGILTGSYRPGDFSNPDQLAATYLGAGA